MKRTTIHDRTLSGVLVGAMLAAAALGACATEPEEFRPTTGPHAEGQGGTDVVLPEGEELFRALESDLIAQCGSCHETGGIADTPFLGNPEAGDPDPYDAITSWPGVVVENAALSALLRWPADGSHSGPPPSSELAASLLDWLEVEASAVDDVATDPRPTLPPFKPIVPGFNALYLDALGADFAGMAVTFDAEELTESALSLSNLELHTTGVLGVRFEHPLWTAYAADSAEGEPDPVDSFSNVAQEIAAGAAAPIGPGMVVLTNWATGGKLSLAFEVIGAVDPQAEPVAEGPCKALDVFIDSAQSQFTVCADTCHGGNNPTAHNAVDMSELTSDPAAACAQIVNRIDLDDPGASQVVINTDPNGNASHPFKFNGSTSAHDAFVAAVTPWIEAEGQAQ